MIASLNIDLILITIFLFLNLGLGLWYGKGIKSIKDFALGGRNFSTAALTTTLIATWISGSNFNIRMSDVYHLGILAIPPIIGGTIYSVILTYIFVPRTREFLGKISLADVMGSLYGNNVRIITAICSILKSTTFVASQIKIFSLIFNHFFGIHSDYATVISSMVVTIYSAFGGIRSVVLTDIFQFLAFGAFIPTLTLLIWNSFGNWPAIVNTVTSNPMFDPSLLLDYRNPTVLKYAGVFFYCLIPCLHPATFHRILIARDMQQLKVAFSTLTVVYLLFSIFSTIIGLILLSANTQIPGNSLLPYIIDNYTYPGIKGLIIIGVVAMIMSTADSHINSAAVIFVNDLCGCFRLFTNNKKLELKAVRIFSMAIGILPLYICLSQKSLLDIMLLGATFYDSIVGVPLAITILGFRSTTRVIISGMTAGTLTTYIWNKYFNAALPIGDIIPATIANLTVMMIMHYMFKEPGGWVGPRNPIPPNVIKAKRDQRNDAILNFLRALPKLLTWRSILAYCSDETFCGTHYYVGYVIFTIVSLLFMAFIGDNTYIGGPYGNMINSIIILFSLGICMLLIYMKTASDRFRNTYMGLAWHVAIFCTLVFSNTILAVNGGFNSTLSISFCINLIALYLLLRWHTAALMMLTGVPLALSFLNFTTKYSGISLDNSVISGFKWNIMNALALVSAVTILIKLKQDQFGKNTQSLLKLGDKLLCMELTIGNKDKKITTLLNSSQYIFNNLNNEIKSPISIARTSINLLYKFLPRYYKSRMLVKEKKKILTMVELAQSGIERVVSYSDNLLDLSAFERRKIVFNIEIHNLKLLAKDIVDEFNKANYNSNHIITFYYHPQAEIIFELDHTRIRQVLRNLISNAIQYSDSGIIAVKVLPYRQGAQIIIEDEGVGIPEDELQNIFKPFQESSRTRSQARGRGLGLTVAREIILHHHGVIFAGNRSGTKGSKFTVQLPIRQPQGNFNKGFHSKNKVFGNPKPYNQPVEDITKNTAALSQKINTIESLKDAEKHIRTHKSIMIIDDDQRFLDTVSLDIFAERYQPTPVLSPFEAINLIKDNPSFYSMIILDMNMPGKSGSDVLHEVNDIIRIYSIPVVVISGYEQPLEMRTLLYALGVKNFIIKPYNTDDIHNLINLHLRQSTMFPFNLSNSKI